MKLFTVQVSPVSCYFILDSTPFLEPRPHTPSNENFPTNLVQTQ